MDSLFGRECSFIGALNGDDGASTWYSINPYCTIYTQSIISLLQVAIVSAIVISKLDVGQVSVESRIDYKGQINLIVHAQFCALPRFYLFAFLRHNHCWRRWQPKSSFNIHPTQSNRLKAKQINRNGDSWIFEANGRIEREREEKKLGTKSLFCSIRHC